MTLGTGSALASTIPQGQHQTWCGQQGKGDGNQGGQQDGQGQGQGKGYTPTVVTTTAPPTYGQGNGNKGGQGGQYGQGQGQGYDPCKSIDPCGQKGIDNGGPLTRYEQRSWKCDPCAPLKLTLTSYNGQNKGSQYGSKNCCDPKPVVWVAPKPCHKKVVVTSTKPCKTKTVVTSSTKPCKTRHHRRHHHRRGYQLTSHLHAPIPSVIAGS